MLFIVYGATLEMGYKTRQFFTGRGFNMIYKHNYVEPDSGVDVDKYKNPQKDEDYKKWFDDKIFIDKKEIEKLDFVYGRSGITVGFNQNQIMEAVRGVNNAILTVGGNRIDFLKQLKTAFGDYVTIIFFFQDEKTIEEHYGKIYGDESVQRIIFCKEMQEIYIENRDIFDETVLYTGEMSLFDHNCLIKQYDDIIFKRIVIEKKLNDKRYVDLPYTGSEGYLFISYAHADKNTVYPVMQMLQRNAVRLWYDDGIPIGANWRKLIMEKINSAAGIVFFSSETSLSSEYVKEEIEKALSGNKDFYCIRLDDGEPELELAQKLQWIELSDVDFESRLLNSLPDIVKE